MNLEMELRKRIILNVRELISLKCKQIESNFALNWIEFYLDEPYLKDKLLGISRSTGIYFFEADMSKFYKSIFGTQNKINSIMRDAFLLEIRDAWRKDKKGNTPAFSLPKAKNFFNLRTNNNLYKNGWVPLYLGKINIKDANEDVPDGLQGRVLEHIYGTSNPSTYAMKLIDKSEFIKTVKFRVTYSELTKYDEENIYWIVALFEKELRKKLSPIIGKQ